MRRTIRAREDKRPDREAPFRSRIAKRTAHVHIAVAAVATLPAAFLMAATSTAPAQASFPGTNGLIAFASDRDSASIDEINDEIYVTDGDGSPPSRLTNNPRLDQWPAVSPNGKEIAFISDRTADSSPTPAANEIYVMDVNDHTGVDGYGGPDGNGDNLRRLTYNGVLESKPVWSPDGRKIAFQRGQGASSDIWLMDADGTEAVNLTQGSVGSDTQPAFSPDGTRIAFQSSRSGGTQIWLLNTDGSPMPDGSTAMALTKPMPSDSGLSSGAGPSFSPDGSRLAFWANREGSSGNFDIYVMKVEPEGVTNEPVNVTNSVGPTNNRFPSWSPDGTKIAYWSGVGMGLGRDADVRVMNADGSNQAPITNDCGASPYCPSGDIQPDWGRARTK